MLVLIDNYDSFTYNLVQYFGELGAVPTVYRNDKISVEDVLELTSSGPGRSNDSPHTNGPNGIVLSPGPSNPDNAGICLALVKAAAEQAIPLLGICLGHQTIGQAFGGKVVRAPSPRHGKQSAITHNGDGLFQDIPSPYTATRYHSLVVERESLPQDLTITAQTEDGLIMGLHHNTAPLYGVQYHPESLVTEHGHTLLNNFLKLSK